MKYYGEAVDYFVGMQSSNYIYFDNKIKTLLMKPKVIDLLSAKEIPETKPKEKMSVNFEYNMKKK